MTITVYGIKDKFQKILTSTMLTTSQDTFLPGKFSEKAHCFLALEGQGH
jgi:hypothetical protein